MDERKRFIKALSNAQSFSVPDRQITPTTDPQGGYLTNLSSSVKSAGGGVLGGILNIPGNIAKDIGRSASGYVQGWQEVLSGSRQKELDGLQYNTDNLDRRSSELTRAYKSGDIDKNTYNEGLRDIADQYSQVAKSSKSIAARSDPKEFAMYTAEALSFPLLFGKLKAFTSTAEGALKLAPSQMTTLTKATLALEKAAFKNPVLRRFLRDTAFNPISRSFADTLKLGSKELSMAYFIRYPLFVGQNVRETRRLLEDLDANNPGGALGHAVLLGLEGFQGGPIGFAFASLKKTGRVASKLTFSQNGMYDLISAAAKWDEGIGEYLLRIKNTNPAVYKQYERSLRAMQQVNLDKFGGHYDAAASLMHWFETARHVELTDKSAEWLVKDLHNFYSIWEDVITHAKAGKFKGFDPADWEQLSLGVMDTATKSRLISELDRIKQTHGLMGMQKYLYQLREEGVQWTQNDKMFRLVAEAIGDPKWKSSIKKIETSRLLDELGIPPALKKKLAKGGYFVNQPQKIKGVFVEADDAGKILSKFAKANDDFSAPTRALPGLGFVGGSLRRLGLSPEETSDFVRQSLRGNLARNLRDEKTLKALVGNSDRDSAVVIRKLQQYAEDIRPGKVTQKLVYGEKFSSVYDIRLLSREEIAKALGITADQAKAVQRAVLQSYLDVPVTIRGLGDRAQDLNLKKFGLSRGYARAQSTYRYTYNPFFRTQEIGETAILSFMKHPGVNTVRGIFGFGRKRITDVVGKIEAKGIFKAQFSGEAAADQLLGKLSASITRPQKESLAGVVMHLAKKSGKTVDELLDQNLDEVADALRVLVQYPRKSILNSSLARTLNIAFFPTRYNLKVAQLTAEAVSELPAAAQLTFINSAFEMGDWLQSEEGLQWQSENSEFLGVIKWLTPLGNLDWSYRVLTGNVDSLSQLGLMGGLPFGFISQMLDSQLTQDQKDAIWGGTPLQRPYVNPKTGDVVPSWVPETTKARAATAITDLLGGMFSYPGRILGLPGKGEMTRDFVAAVMRLDPDSSEFKKEFDFEKLTDDQINFILAVKQLQGGKTTPGPSLYLPPLPEIRPREKLPTTKQSTGRRGKKTARPFVGASALDL